jgi:hypothetical protein
MLASALLQEFVDFQGFPWMVADGVAGTTPAEELRRRKTINVLNAAIRWAWKEHDPMWSWPWTLSTATVTHTDGKIAAADLGGATWCSVWDIDPRPTTNEATPYNAIPDIDKGALVIPDDFNSLPATLFVFFRTTTPQLVYGETSVYSTPEIPDQLRHPILMYASATAMQSAAQNDEAVKYMQTAVDWMNNRMDGIGLSNPVWMKNPCAL